MCVFELVLFFKKTSVWAEFEPGKEGKHQFANPSLRIQSYVESYGCIHGLFVAYDILFQLFARSYASNDISILI